MSKASKRVPQQRPAGTDYALRTLAAVDRQRAELLEELDRLDGIVAYQVFRLHEAGWSWSRIGARYGVSAQRAHQRWGPPPARAE